MEFKKALNIIINDPDYKEGDYHQAILNLGYDEYQKNKNWYYIDMLNYMKTTYGDLAMWAVLIGKANQQICNGGFMQYFDNGYASEGKGGFGCKHSTNLELHNIATQGIQDSGLIDIVIGKKVYNVFTDFYIELDEEGDRYVANTYDLNKLDSRYYKLNEQWMEILNQFFKQEIEKVL